MVKELPLTKGYIALVDDQDYVGLSQYSWWACVCGGGLVYARGWVNKSRIKMHRLILDAPVGIAVDHINRNTLDNRRSNLRLCTMSENLANIATSTVNSSGYKGVSWHRATRKWAACLHARRKEFYLGEYETPQEAALAYDEAARIHFGEFALTNEQMGLLPNCELRGEVKL